MPLLPPLRRDQLDALDNESLITLIVSMQEQMSTMAAEIQSLRDQLAKNVTTQPVPCGPV